MKNVSSDLEIREISLQDYKERFTEVFDIGSGSFGKVIKAIDNECKKMIAIKVILQQGSYESTYKCVQNEITMMNKFKMKEICNLSDYFHINSSFYLILEFCSLGNISKYKTKMTSPILLAIIRDISKPLEKFHKEGFVHYDIKPQNILLTLSGDIKVCDFGIMGRELESVKNTTNAISSLKKGTEMYMAPEVKEMNQLSTAADIYSLGVTIFEMISGIPLCLTNCTSSQQWFDENQHKISNGKPIAPIIEKIVNSCLISDPSSRISAINILKMIPSLPPSFILLKDLTTVDMGSIV
ncbi:STE family protein kinase [Trichomonas vaginalis G3]|uniref:STE family protein kinase n=1 Tax=Trichomonas vaginalis (strain ATCC PRA-98 / G3) TaxID=412133 RepID=A2EEV9_TRIV3|nr:MAP kinase kinase kinase kinase protein [Trichomonas vaginalis G3]EAY08825.1 STE family protein kinase [Trichomonas vaginalis G3]KAI5542059.1 MAP kinase kinase kinase kinase protein [Trichomonas vaginalis G3]|eukprot:XP_001321048.1 STE family protein kinase [Trichomonas vaginalis G3]